jgi:hypothetical protein
MATSRLDRVRIDVAGEIIEISSDERDLLLEELIFVPACKTIRRKLEAAEASGPVELDAVERSRLRGALEQWTLDVVQPEGIERLHAALVRADLGGSIHTPLG